MSTCLPPSPSTISFSPSPHPPHPSSPILGIGRSCVSLAGSSDPGPASMLPSHAPQATTPVRCTCLPAFSVGTAFTVATTVQSHGWSGGLLRKNKDKGRGAVRAWIQEEAGWVRQDTGGYGIPLEHGYRRRLGGCARIQEDTGVR